MSEEDGALDPLITAPVEIPAKMLGLVLNIARRLSSVDGEKFHSDLSDYVREWKKQDVIHIKAPPLLPDLPEAVDLIADVAVVPAVIHVPPVTVSLIIHVDRVIPPEYPKWARKVMDKELEFTGPEKYDAGKLELWVHPGQTQKTGMKGNALYEHLKDSGLLVGCLGLRDLDEIRQMGLADFRQYWPRIAVCGWKSVVEDDKNRLYAPSLFEHKSRVVVDWRWLGLTWHASRPALRFAD